MHVSVWAVLTIVLSSTSSTARAALLRRASVGNFEIVEESADKKIKAVRFWIEK